MRGYNIMKGYWNDAQKTREAIDDNRWYHTGDLGVMDDNGYFQIIGRNKDMIIRGGENIFPKEIEIFLVKHEKVSDA